MSGVFRYNMTLTKADLENPKQLVEHLGQSLAVIIEMLLPLFTVIIIVTFGSSMVLGGWMFRPANVLPKLSKLNPISGIKRISPLDQWWSWLSPPSSVSHLRHSLWLPRQPSSAATWHAKLTT